LRLGVAELGSIPSWLFIPIAFVVLVILRFGSLVLGGSKPEAEREEKKGKVTLMAHFKSMLSMVAETARALGGSMLAGLPLLS